MAISARGHQPSRDSFTSSSSSTTSTRTTTDRTQPHQKQKSSSKASQLAQNAILFSQQAEKLSHQHPSSSLFGGATTGKPSRDSASSIRSSSSTSSVAVEARFVTPQDPIIVTSDGNRLPGVPLEEAHKLNVLREELEAGGGSETVDVKDGDEVKERVKTAVNEEDNKNGNEDSRSSEPDRAIQLAQKHKHGFAVQQEAGTLGKTKPPSHTNPLFPPLPLYGPPSTLRDLQCLLFRISSFFLSLAFLGVIVQGALFTSIPLVCNSIYHMLTFQSLDKKRPFHEEEQQRAGERRKKEQEWKRRQSSSSAVGKDGTDEEYVVDDEFLPTEGGKDPIICDIAYYARRVGLDVETFKVQTEDGFIIDLHHVYDPKEHIPRGDLERDHLGPDVFQSFDTNKHPHTMSDDDDSSSSSKKKPKFPVLLMHGLLQSVGAYCCNDDSSLAFWLCKSGYDVWLGANRCGFSPQHALLSYADPRMWCWNIRQMGVFDLPALTSRVLRETNFNKIGLIAHSQGTTQTLVALAKEQRPDIGSRLTVFCGLAPAAYAGPLIGKMYFRFMRIISPAMFRLIFGIHAFIPLMMTMHGMLPPRLYGWLGYKVFSFLFSWSDTRWDRGLRDRMFQFAPVYVSAESMRWWLGRECFAAHKCILSTEEVVQAEEREMDNEVKKKKKKNRQNVEDGNGSGNNLDTNDSQDAEPGSTAWYDDRAPPFAFWVCGSDELVDGRRLLRRFETGREPHVRVVHSSVIPEYEHLDVLWAMDAEDKVFRELREVLWKTCDTRDICRVPVGCEHVTALDSA